MQPQDSQILESYVPVYDAAPDKWEDARPFIVEQLKRLANAVNVREIGYFLDEELLSGKAFIPSANQVVDSAGSQVFRSILRVVVPFPNGLSIGLNSAPHNVFIDANFSLMQLYAAATNASTLMGEPIPNGADTITYDFENINITVAAAYTRAWAVMEYIVEI